MNTWSTTVIVPVRAVVPVCAPTEKENVPLPVPVPPVVMVIQSALLEANHTQPGCVVTFTVLEPPSLTTEISAGESTKMHEVAPAWLIEKGWPATVRAPDRGSGEKFASTLNETVPVLLPVIPAVTLIHSALLVLDHVHPAAVFGSVLAYLIFYWALRHMEASRLSASSYLIPILAIILGILLLGERVTPNLLIGGPLVLGGVYLAERRALPL